MAKNLVRSPATTITTAPPQRAQPPTVVVVGKTIIIITRRAPSSARVIAITAISSQIRTHIRTKKDQTVRSPATIVTETK